MQTLLRVAAVGVLALGFGTAALLPERSYIDPVEQTQYENLTASCAAKAAAGEGDCLLWTSPPSPVTDRQSGIRLFAASGGVLIALVLLGVSLSGAGPAVPARPDARTAVRTG
ncbi:MAG: hypothetical protein WD206_01545 [Actinomycetota bacterium]